MDYKLSTYLSTKHKQMFEISPLNWTAIVISYHQGVSNKCFCSREGTYMNKEERIKIIVEWLKKADDKQLERLQCFIQAFLKASES